MDSSVPLLNPQQIEELDRVVNAISRENSKTLEDLLGDQVDIDNATILQLYNLVVEEWGKKQKTIENLCHFSLTMMSTVEYLWSQKSTQQERISNAEVVIDNLNRHIQEVGDQNEIFKRKISEAEFHIDQIAGQKQKIEELYRSQSCINFISAEQQVTEENKKMIDPEEKSLCCDHERKLEEEKSKLIEESFKIMGDKEDQITFLREENIQLEKKLSSLLEEHELAKMEVELAEIAVQDALSYRSSSILSSSRSDLYISDHQQIYTTKSQAQFMNGDLQCFSNINESFNLEQRGSLMKQTEIQNFKCKTEPSCPLFNDSFEDSSIIAKENNEDITAAESPFKKKSSKISSFSDSAFLPRDSDVTTNNLQEKSKNRFIKNKKTVSLQCNLVKGLHNLCFDYKKNTYEEDFKPKLKPAVSVPEKTEKKGKKQKKERKEKKVEPISKSQIVKPSFSMGSLKKPQVQNKNDNSFSSVYSFFSTKLISQRIKVN